LRFSLDHSKSAPPQRKLLSDGLVAEWLRRGLQILTLSNIFNGSSEMIAI